MIVYWIMYLAPAALTLSALLGRHYRSRGLAAGAILFLFLFIGFRETGGDYPRYELLFQQLSGHSLAYAISKTEPIYGFINWFVQAVGLGFGYVTLITSAIYSYCLWRFVKAEPFPLLALSIATAYLTIVVAMGYTRQGVAIGLVMLATVAIRDRRALLASLILIVAVGFHYSAAIAFGLIFHAVRLRSKLQTRLLGIALAIITSFGVYSLLRPEFSDYVAVYVESSRYASGGAVQRLLLCWIAALIVISFRRRWPEVDRALWTSVSLASLGTSLLLFISSTVADRLGLYLLPLQVVAFGRLPFVYTKNIPLITVAVLFGYFLVLGTWLVFGNFSSELWLPYRSSLLGSVP